MLNSTPSDFSPRGNPYQHIIYMAQSKSFFGLRRGSTKTLTFSVYNGKQVTKDRVTDVKNPRSSAQMKQRAIMATALRGYSALQEICDHSFEGITYGQKSMNYFVSINARMIRSAAPKVNLSLSKGNSVSNAYIISRGSLQTISVDKGDVEGTTYFFIPISLKSTSTFSDFMAAFGGTEIGDMVTFVNLVDNVGGNASAYWLRLKLTDTNKDKVVGSSEESYDILSKLTEGTDYETNIDNFSPMDWPLLVKQTSLFIGNGTTTSAPEPQSLGVVLSRKTDAGWLRSSSTMLNIDDTFNYDEALASYPESGEKVLNGGNM